MSLNKDDDFPASLMDPAKPAAAPPGAGAGAGVAVSALSLVLTTAGAGVLAFPYAAAQTGVLPLLSLLAALAALSAWCGLINAEAAWRAQRAAPLRARTFDELAGRTEGLSRAVLHNKHLALRVIFYLSDRISVKPLVFLIVDSP